MPDNSYVAAKRFGAVAANTAAICALQASTGGTTLVLNGSAVGTNKFFSATSANDGSNMATTVTITSAGGQNNAGITFTITGTDINGATLSEAGLTGPGAGATVTTTAAFLTVTAVKPSGTVTGTVSAGFTATSTTQGIVFAGRTRVRGMHGISVATAGTANFRNTSQTGDVILALDSSGAVDYIDPYIPDNGTLFKAGCFLNISNGFGAITVFYDGPNPTGS